MSYYIYERNGEWYVAVEGLWNETLAGPMSKSDALRWLSELEEADAEAVSTEEVGWYVAVKGRLVGPMSRGDALRWLSAYEEEAAEESAPGAG